MAFLTFKWILPFIVSLLHPFYVSVTEINHNQKEKSVEITCKVFVDDMEEALRINYRSKADLSNENLQAQNNKLINDYFLKHLALAADGKQMKLNFLGFEKESESVYCYFEVTNISAIKKLELTNSILQDFTDKQINIVHVTVNNSRKSYKLDYPNKQASFSF